LGQVSSADVSYLDENFTKHFSDLVLSLNLKGSSSKIKVYCLLEHKSTPSPLVGLQILRYMALQWTDLLDNKKISGSKLPPNFYVAMLKAKHSPDYSAQIN